jgi:tetratricopeptide (TPR) repeat protein
MAQDRPGEAAGHFERALSLDPARTELRTNLGLALVRLARTSDRVAVRVSLATALVAVGRLPEAVARLEDAARFSPPDALLDFFRQVTAAQPGAAVPRLGLFQAYLRAGDHARARETYEALAGLDPALALASRSGPPGSGASRPP